MENTINIIKTFAILHNLCIITGDPVIYQQLVEMIFDVHLHNIFCKTQYKFIMFWLYIIRFLIYLFLLMEPW